MERVAPGFRHIHIWLLLPFFITLVGFKSYWLDFSNAPIHWHLHGLSATLWYLLLILQPYFFAKQSMSMHRVLGMIGLVLAGFVSASAFAVVRGHIKDLDPVLDLIYEYRYSLSLTDFIYVIGFIFSVCMAVVHRRSIDWHSRWLLSTVFWVLSPATDRVTYVVMQGLGWHTATWFDFPMQFFISHAAVIAVLVLLIILDRLNGIKAWIPYALVILAQLAAPVILVTLKDSQGLANWFEQLYRLPYS